MFLLRSWMCGDVCFPPAGGWVRRNILVPFDTNRTGMRAFQVMFA